MTDDGVGGRGRRLRGAALQLTVTSEIARDCTAPPIVPFVPTGLKACGVLPSFSTSTAPANAAPPPSAVISIIACAAAGLSRNDSVAASCILPVYPISCPVRSDSHAPPV